MKAPFPIVRAVMARRILLNYRVQPEVMTSLLPRPFVPKVVRGWAMAGICLIRLEEMRPAGLPRWCGLASENAAHRIAVQWTGTDGCHDGVFIPRRDTDSFINRMAGGRLFPGVHHAARFRCSDQEGLVLVDLESRDGQTRVKVAAHQTDNWSGTSLFRSLGEASDFLCRGGCGWSIGHHSGTIEGVELQLKRWEMWPLAVEHVNSSFFSDASRFAPGTVEFDSALVMRNVQHEWRRLNDAKRRLKKK